MTLSDLNQMFESDPEATLPASLWVEWLWQTDLHEPVSVDCLLNRAHLLGLLIARYRASREPWLMNVCVSLGRHMVYAGSRVATMTARQLQDTVQDLQMHWEQYVSECTAEALTEMVDALMARFGYLCLHPSPYDDVAMRDAEHAERMSVLCLRRFVSVFCVLYRHLDLLHRCVEPDGEAGSVEPIMDFHVQASMEEYHRHVMHSELPPAARLLYRQDFPGVYHCVSQVVYFHFPSYERRPQLTNWVELGAHPIHALAPLRELYPEIGLCCEDEIPSCPSGWCWLLMGKRVYLLDPEGVVYTGGIIRLAEVFVSKRQQ